MRHGVRNNVCFFEGEVGGPIWTFPVGVRPARETHFIGMNGKSTASTVLVSPDGTVRVDVGGDCFVSGSFPID